MSINIEDSHNGIALYYPYMHIQDVNWLKSSLLYWDIVRRIVPDSYETKDHGDVIKTVDEGLLRNTDPNIYKDAAAERFVDEAEPLLDELPEIKTKLIKPSNGKEDYTEITIRYDLIHREKMPQKLKSFLQDRKLLADNPRRNELSFVRSGVSDLYMTCLASEVSESMHTPLLTDKTYNEKAAYYFSIATSSPLEKRTEQQMSILRMLVDFPTAESLAKIDMEKIISFNKRRIDERLRFRSVMKEVMDHACSLDDPTAFEDFISGKRKEIERVNDNMKKSLLAIGVDSYAKGVAISSPSFIASASAALGVINPAIGMMFAALGLTISTTAWYFNTDNKFRKFRNENDYYYLNSLEREISKQARKKKR